MGLVTLGPPDEIVLELAKLNNATVFVETGTFHGGTTRWASGHFNSVYTVEKSESIFALNNKELSKLKGVKPLLGDSRELLPRILAEIGDHKTIFWLDGHWSGGETAGSDDECPLLGELACLSKRKEDIILIDDARLFLSVPPLPHKPSDWPTIPDVIDVLSGSRDRPFIQIIDDIIFAIPNREPLKSTLIKYTQARSIPFWNNLGNFNPRNLQRDDLKTILKKLKHRFIHD
jgi:hypothetical protein